MGADKPQDSTGASLEPPKLFGRRGKAIKPAAESTQAPGEAETAEPVAADATAAPAAGVPTADDTRVFEDAPLFTDVGSVEAAPMATDPAESPTAVPATAPASATKRPRVPKMPQLPQWSLVVPRPIGAAVVGLLTGAALLALVWVGFRGCEALRGTESCGTAPGMLALVVVFTLTVLVGWVLLRLIKLPEPGMTSFLAVGITCLVASLLLDDLFDSAAILVVLPLVSAVAFAGSWWLATQQVDLDA